MKVRYGVLSRILDVALVCAALPLVLALIVLVAVVHKLIQGGPLFYSQLRVGKGEKLFRIYKFRTMVENADTAGSSVTTGRDPRITPFGRFLRKTKLDELPQLFNILKGDMGFVGPRPDVPEIIRTYTPGMRRIFQVRPGLTSYATLHLCDEEQLLARVKDPEAFYENTLVPLKVRLAMEHVERTSFFFDLRILAQTLFKLSFPGALLRLREDPLVSELRHRVAGGRY